MPLELAAVVPSLLLWSLSMHDHVYLLGYLKLICMKQYVIIDGLIDWIVFKAVSAIFQP